MSDVKPFSEALRYAYNLTPDSVVMDIGGYQGGWTNIIHEKYRCTVHLYEPVDQFFNHCVERFKGNPKIHLYPLAIGGKDGWEQVGIKGDMSGIFCTSPNETIGVPVCDVARALHHVGGKADLIAINAEGSEYAIMERLLDAGLMPNVGALSVQFHTVAPDYEERHAKIRERMTATHKMDYDEAFCWTGWSLLP